ncbi:hypothetical protein ACOCJ7_02625 [Knoellia sp. CPCC 206453]|uniref:hypothetical protein n=1 Tax=Knoellia pratensis TaxID=3404796 RepID=UPI00360AD56F
MPQFVDPDHVALTLRDGEPTITLRDVEVSSAEVWSFLNRATLLVVDGPGDEGFLLRRLDGQGNDVAPAGWDDAVASHGSVTVLASGTRIVATALEQSTEEP